MADHVSRLWQSRQENGHGWKRFENSAFERKWVIKTIDIQQDKRLIGNYDSGGG